MNNANGMFGLMKIYCLYDAKGEHYGNAPMFYQHRADAIRDFEKAVNDEKSALFPYAADFTLFEIGTWNQRTGEVVMFETKYSLGSGNEFKRQAAQVEPIAR